VSAPVPATFSLPPLHLHLKCLSTLWCLIEGDNVLFPVKILSTQFIAELKKEIKKEASPTLEKFDAKDLILWKVHYF
jgi:hypothetical protein